jgi:uncharacterized membrane protein
MVKTIKVILILGILLGIFFRFYNLDRKIYWHDEVYTIFRSGGYDRAEIDWELFNGEIKSTNDLKKYLSIKPESSIFDTLHSLKTEDPQHPPLYFIVNRYWMSLFGSSILANRSLAVLISLVSLPLIYLLVSELFKTDENISNLRIDIDFLALMSTTLLALSPVDILFAQTARQYSALTLSVICSAYFLVRALKDNKLSRWFYFSISIACSLYIHPFFALSLFALGCFIVLYRRDSLFSFILFGVLGLFLYLPWIIVLMTNVRRALATTNWATIDVGFDYLVKLWTLSFTSLFFDLDVGFNNVLTYVMRLPFLILIFWSVFLLLKDNHKATSGILLTSGLIPFLILVSADLILGGKRSAVTRYLISCFPFIQIIVAYGIIRIFSIKKTIGIIMLSFIFVASLSSIVVSSQAKTWWNKDLSYNNASIIQTINQSKRPIVVSDIGDYYTNTGDLIAMSAEFKTDVRFVFIPENYTVAQIFSALSLDNTEQNFGNINEIFVFRPSQKLLTEFKSTAFEYKLLY